MIKQNENQLKIKKKQDSLKEQHNGEIAVMRAVTN